MWFFVVGQEKSEINKRVLIEIINPLPNSIIIDNVTNETIIHLIGPHSLIQRVAIKRIIKIINLTNLELGTHIFQINTKNLKLPPEIKILRIDPNILQLTLISCEEREVSILPVIKGKPTSGFELAKINIKPIKIIILGTNNNISNTNYIFTSPLNINNRKKPFSKQTRTNLSKKYHFPLNNKNINITINIKSYQIFD